MLLVPAVCLVFMSNEFMNKVLEMLGRIYISFWFGGGVFVSLAS